MSFTTPIIMAPIVGSSVLAMSYLGVNHYVLNSHNNVDLAVFKPVPSSIKEEHEKPQIPHLALHKEEAMFEFDLSKYKYPWNGLIIQRLDEQPSDTYDHSGNVSRRYFFKYKDGKSYKITIYRKVPSSDPSKLVCKIKSTQSTQSTQSTDGCEEYEIEFLCYLTWDYFTKTIPKTTTSSDFHGDNNKFQKNFYYPDSNNSVSFLLELFTLASHEANKEDCTAISLDNVAFVNLNNHVYLF